MPQPEDVFGEPPAGLPIDRLPEKALINLPFDLSLDLDIFVASFGISPHFGATNRIFTNDGAGGFTESSAPGGEQASADVALGDLDGDGDLDAIIVNNGTNQILINQGGAQGGDEGTFEAVAAPADPPGPAPGVEALSRGVALGDLDGDGDLDVFIANEASNSLYGAYNQVLLNDGSGGFTAVTETTGGERASFDVALGDLDGDGDLDAFVANRDGADQILFNDGTGSFTAVTNAPGTGGQSRHVVLGDLDGDGDLDVFVASSSGTNKVLINQGGAQGGDEGTFLAADAAGGAANSWAVAFGDLDGDGHLDAFVANIGTNQVLMNNGDGTFTAATETLGGSWFSFDVEMADLDDDGDLDVYIANDGAEDQILWNDGTGVFTSVTAVGGTERSIGAAIGDLDGDGVAPAAGDDGLPYLGSDFLLA